MGPLFGLVFPLVPIIGLILIVRYGPIRSRWWHGENALGFAVFVGAIAFLVGFIGPMIVDPEANQGPLLGIFITGPLGFVVGIVWGLVRAARRRVDERARRS
ncbi:MAG: hypothetical protein MNPFHGCM_02147 [Gemmatimonadaceae bacterium]|nr:hypothetical protein [Gemmatimonadaceae bacterium]